MGLIEKIFGKESGEKFADKELEGVMQDASLKHYFFNEDGSEKEGRDIDLLKKGLHDKIKASYRSNAQDYFENRGFLSKYISPVLRGVGAVGDVVGTYMFWAYGGSGFEAKFVSMGIKSLADIVDGVHYLKHNQGVYDIGAVAKIAGEAVVERAAAVWPLGIGEAVDLVRGRKKFDNKVASKTVNYAKKQFIKEFGKYESRPLEDEVQDESQEQYIVPVARFKNPVYAKTEHKKAA
ncbi:hypothetical protein ACFLZB_04865 [Nanoarchaeota archaeon]